MAKKFLTHIDLQGNQLLKATLEKLSADPVDTLVEGRIYYNTTAGAIKVYDGTAWVGIGEIVSITGTSGEIDVTVVDGVATISLPSTVNVDISGNAATADYATSAGSASTATNADYATSAGSATNADYATSAGSATTADSATNADYATTAGTANAVAANSVALGTDTTGDYVASVSGTDGVSISGSGEGAAVTIANTDKGSSQNIFKNVSVNGTTIVADNNDDTLTIAAGSGISVSGNATSDTVTISNDGVTSISGTTNEIEVSGSTGSVTVGLPNDVIIGNDLTVSGDAIVQGDLTVNGTTTYINTQDLNIEDNIITLNYGTTGSPTKNAGIEVARGDSPTTALRWNETSDIWDATTDGSTYKKILLSGDAASTDISDFAEAAQDAVGGILADTATIDFTYSDATPEITADVKLATTSYLSGTSGLAVDISSVETKLVTDGFTKKASANVGNGTNTSFAISHNLGTRDVVVNVYDNSSYDTVECDVVRTDTNTVTVSFATAPATNSYRVVVIG